VGKGWGKTGEPPTTLRDLTSSTTGSWPGLGIGEHSHLGASGVTCVERVSVPAPGWSEVGLGAAARGMPPSTDGTAQSLIALPKPAAPLRID
jgi:hypothetical protein